MMGARDKINRVINRVINSIPMPVPKGTATEIRMPQAAGIRRHTLLQTAAQEQMNKTLSQQAQEMIMGTPAETIPTYAGSGGGGGGSGGIGYPINGGGGGGFSPLAAQAMPMSMPSNAIDPLFDDTPTTNVTITPIENGYVVSCRGKSSAYFAADLDAVASRVKSLVAQATLGK